MKLAVLVVVALVVFSGKSILLSAEPGGEALGDEEFFFTKDVYLLDHFDQRISSALEGIADDSPGSKIRVVSVPFNFWLMYFGPWKSQETSEASKVGQYGKSLVRLAARRVGVEATLSSDPLGIDDRISSIPEGETLGDVLPQGLFYFFKLSSIKNKSDYKRIVDQYHRWTKRMLSVEESDDDDPD